MILKNHTSTSIRKKRLNPTTKARREISRNKFVEKSEAPDRIQSFGEVASSENRPRSRPGFVKPISRRDRISSKCFETQKVSEIGRKEVGESRSFPIILKIIIKDVFQMEEKERKD